ncbi:hypothetical protein XI03_31240 [Bradyrhizobium sp. CCBAU 65884]|uniref:hypothetical protein n=1 Tax=Bradyrhizobium sp. CCBAU 65884 TaxID=722477 RepID=UPI00230603DF|nr:hypothetical protein [Bradyrhizobium sp. CCBAU 65884]MDA9478886.1 hypothetical protein [Bradyrhizobium sp. CCBAU 65884]
MSAAAETPAPDDLEAAADQAIVACGGDARQAVKALLVANGFLEAQVEDLRASVSAGYSRGRFDVPRDRKDWYD